jgi:hypothetical protein
MKKVLVISILCLILGSCAPAGTITSLAKIGPDPRATLTTSQAINGKPDEATNPNLVTPTATAPSAVTDPPTATLPTVLPAMDGLTFPIRAAFYYPWFPQSWKQSGMDPFTHYRPTLGFYSQDDTAVVQQQIAAMQYGKIQLGIASWWGQGHYTDQRFGELLQAGEKAGFYWAVYIESEGQGDPSVESIRADLQYIHDVYSISPAYLKIGGRFLVFVYADPKDGCNMVDRWTQANNAGAYLVLKVFSGYRYCANQPDGWHQYAPVGSQKTAGKFSFTISPGFWKATEPQPRLARNLQHWDAVIQSMLASHANFQLITTFNEWGEGTAVESAQGWESPSGFGLYLDALHYDGKSPQ